MLTHRITALAAAAALAALLPALAGAQTDPKAALRAAISGVLRPMLGESSAPIVEKLMTVKPDGAISHNFDLGKVTTALFGRTATTAAPDCRTTQTPAKEPDPGLCIIDAGNRESETGAYTMLAFSKNIGIGDIMFMRRAAFDPASTALPPAVKLTDAEAYTQALAFLNTLGVPKSEIPLAPAGAKNRLPVRSLVVGAEEQPGSPNALRIPIQKVVSIPRAFLVPGGLIHDPTGAILLSHVVAPGGATVALADGSVRFARIDGWSDAQIDPKMDPRLAKTTTELINEITDDLWGEGVRKTGTLSILIALRRAMPNPDDPNPPLCPACGVLRAALKVMVSQPGPGVVESSEKSYVAPGLVREYDLVAQTEAERPAR